MRGDTNGGENTVGCGVFFAKDLCCAEAVNEDRLPPDPLVCERWKSCRPAGSLKYVVSVWTPSGRVVYAVSFLERSEVKSHNPPIELRQLVGMSKGY